MRTALSKLSILLSLLALLASCGKDSEVEEQEIPITGGPFLTNFSGWYYKAFHIYFLKEDRTAGMPELVEDIHKIGVPLEFWFKNEKIYLPVPFPNDSLYSRWTEFRRNATLRGDGVTLCVGYEYEWDDGEGWFSTTTQALPYERSKGRFQLIQGAPKYLNGNVIYEGEDVDDIHKFHYYQIAYEPTYSPDGPMKGDYRFFDTYEEAITFARKTMELGDHYRK